MTNATYQSLRVTRADFRVAIAFTKTVHILYTGTNGVAEWREIEPHEVRETKEGNLTVVAMCRSRRERRTFRLDRISHYNSGTTGFILDWPEAGDPNEMTDWWSFTSRSGHEVLQLEVATPSDCHNRYPLVLGAGMEKSGKVRAVCKAERGISLRRLRRREVIALN